MPGLGIMIDYAALFGYLLLAALFVVTVYGIYQASIINEKELIKEIEELAENLPGKEADEITALFEDLEQPDPSRPQLWMSDSGIAMIRYPLKDAYTEVCYFQSKEWVRWDGCVFISSDTFIANI